MLSRQASGCLAESSSRLRSSSSRAADVCHAVRVPSFSFPCAKRCPAPGAMTNFPASTYVTAFCRRRQPHLVVRNRSVCCRTRASCRCKRSLCLTLASEAPIPMQPTHAASLTAPGKTLGPLAARNTFNARRPVDDGDILIRDVKDGGGRHSNRQVMALQITRLLSRGLCVPSHREIPKSRASFVYKRNNGLTWVYVGLNHVSNETFRC